MEPGKMISDSKKIISDLKGYKIENGSILEGVLSAALHAARPIIILPERMRDHPDLPELITSMRKLIEELWQADGQDVRPIVFRTSPMLDDETLGFRDEALGNVLKGERDLQVE